MIKEVIEQYKKSKIGIIALIVLLLFIFIGVFAPFFASSRPIMVCYEGKCYFPLFRYLFYGGFYTKPIDLFFNLFIVTLPLLLLCLLFCKIKLKWIIYGFIALQVVLFTLLLYFPLKDPTFQQPLKELKDEPLMANSWNQQVKCLTPYAKLNLLILAYLEKKQDQTFKKYVGEKELNRLLSYQIQEGEEKALWIEEELPKMTHIIMPLIRPYHWEEATFGSLQLNRHLPFFERTRTNHKDLTASLIFGIRVSLVVGALSVLLSLLIGIPFGGVAGYYGGRVDLILSRLLEIWESMPTFFMLLLIVAIMRSKSIFITIGVLGVFGWTQIARFLRAEILKQKALPYVDAAITLGFKDRYIIFNHLLPNAIAPVITLLPFAVMAAITSEAALSFLGLGEEGSSSFGTLMDEGRSAFPAESYLLWPPSIMLTLLLISIAIVGDTLRDALDPRLRS